MAVGDGVSVGVGVGILVAVGDGVTVGVWLGMGVGIAVAVAGTMATWATVGKLAETACVAVVQAERRKRITAVSRMQYRV